MSDRPSSDDRANDEVEVLARKALGAALTQIWGDSVAPPQRPVVVDDAEVAGRAIEILRQRVPPGPELDLAVRVLEEGASGAPS
jgi:hypothetical protein